MDDHIDAGAARQFEKIRAGGRQLLVVTRQRIGEALDEVDKGDFMAAHHKLQQASGAMSQLAQAQQFIAVADGSRMVKAVDLEEGLYLTDVGEVTSVEVEECASPQCPGHVTLKIGEHELTLLGCEELYVSDEPE